MSNKKTNNNDVSSTKNIVLAVAKKKINGPLAIGTVLSPSIVILLLASNTDSYDPSGLMRAVIWTVFIIPAFVSVILIVAGLSKALESQRNKRNQANPKIVQHSYRYTYLVFIIVILFFDLLVIFTTLTWILFTAAYVFFLTIMVIILGLTTIPLVINIKNYRKITH
jgi:MFS family permease